LINRTTRSIAATEAGARLLERLAPALGEVEAAMDVVNNLPRSANRNAQETSLVSCCVDRCVVLKAYSDIRLEVIVEDGSWAACGGLRCAEIRYDEQLEPDMVAVPIAPHVQRFATVASPSYLDTHGRPEHLRPARPSCLRGQF
jgi:DNA-binding transcriptional LysR family regulator